MGELAGRLYLSANTTVTSYLNFIFLKSAWGWSAADWSIATGAFMRVLAIVL